MDADLEYKEIVSLLEGHGFRWVVEEVNLDIEAGKFSVAKRQTFKEAVRHGGLFPEELTYSPGPTEEFTVSQEYSSNERLALLIEAVRRVLVDPVIMHKDLFDRVSDSIDAISFVPERPGDGAEHELKRQGVDERTSKAKSLLTEIEGRLKDLRQ